mgnify:CR=1 FL=1
MRKNETESKQKILEAAEAEFLEKGYEGAKTIAIAKRAGVSHTMLHYYYSTKEELFQRIFKEKAQLLSQMFNVVLEQNATFTETLRLLIETQFNFVATNPQLPMFVSREILSNKENLQWLIQTIYPHLLPFLSAFEKMFNAELSKGTIRPVTFQNLLMNVISLNISTFIAMPMLKEALQLNSNEKIEKFLAERLESNVQFILNALRP